MKLTQIVSTLHRACMHTLPLIAVLLICLPASAAALPSGDGENAKQPAKTAIQQPATTDQQSVTATQPARPATELSLRTNLLWAGVAEPNLALDIMAGPHFTVGINAGLKPWPRWWILDWDNSDDNVHWRNFAIVPNVRWWPRRSFDGLFLGADFVYTHFNVGAVTFPFGLYPDAAAYRLQGSFWGGGLNLGYSFWLNDRWRLELEGGAAAGLAAYAKYDCPHCGTKLGTEQKVAVVPKLGLNIAYNLTPRSRRVSQSTGVVISEGEVRTIITPTDAFIVHLRDAVATADSTQDAVKKLNGEVFELIKARKYREAVEAITSDPALTALVVNDAEATNAYGIALYFRSIESNDPNGRSEAVQIIENASSRGSKAAAMNLKGIQNLKHK